MPGMGRLDHCITCSCEDQHPRRLTEVSPGKYVEYTPEELSKQLTMEDVVRSWRYPDSEY